MLRMIEDNLSAIITAFVAIIAMIVNYKSSKNQIKSSFNNNLFNMKFSQKEKIADQLTEKVALLITKCNPNSLNTLINDIVPKELSHKENQVIRAHLLGLSDEIQILSHTIKMLVYSVHDTEEMLDRFSDIANKLDNVERQCSEMLLALTKIYSSMTPEGRIRNIIIMNEVRKLESDFSINYKEPFLELTTALFDIIWYIRKEAMPIKAKKSRKKKNANK